MLLDRGHLYFSWVLALGVSRETLNLIFQSAILKMGLCLRKWRVFSLGIIYTSVSGISCESQLKGPLCFFRYFKGFCTIYEIMCVYVHLVEMHMYEQRPEEGTGILPSLPTLFFEAGSLSEPSTFISHASVVASKTQWCSFVSNLLKVRVTDERKRKKKMKWGMVTHIFSSSTLEVAAGRSLWQSRLITRKAVVRAWGLELRS